MRGFLRRYGKAVAAVLVVGLVTAQSVTSGDGRVSGEEWFQIATETAGAIGVYLVPALPQYPWAKTAQAALFAALMVAGSVALDGISANDTINIVLAILGAVGIGFMPAASGKR